MSEGALTYTRTDLIEDIELTKERNRQRRIRHARRELDAEEATDGLEPATIASFWSEAMVPDDDQDWSIEGLLPEGGRALMAGFRKSGKTLMSLNLAAAWASPVGGTFLDRFACQPLPAGAKVVWLNLELTQRQARRWLRRLSIDEETASKIVAIHARGSVSAYAPTMPHGREELVRLLKETGATRLIVDPVAPLMAACGLDIANPRDTQLFLNAMERIFSAAGVAEVVYVTHVGKSDAKANDGMETAIGAERWESAVDAIWTIGRVKDSTERWIRAEGRDVELDETVLVLDEATGRLSLDAKTEGLGRRAARLETLVERVVEIVEQNPGIKKGDLRGHSQMKAKGDEAGAAIGEAIRQGLVREEAGPHGSILHFLVDLSPGQESWK